jgi:hypothetical protein
VWGPDNGVARIQIDGDGGGGLELPPGEYVFTTYLDENGRPALRIKIRSMAADKEVVVRRTGSEASIKLRAIAAYEIKKGSLILEVGPGGLAQVEYTIGGSTTVVLVGSSSSVRLDESLAAGGTLSEVVVTAVTGSVTVNGVALALEATLTIIPVDIKPGSAPNSINLGSGGVVPVAILTTPTFDAASVDPFSITLADAAVRVKGKSGNAGALQDVDGDGDLDLVVQVNTEALELTAGDVVAVLKGQTYGGSLIMGIDSISVVR